MSQRIEVREAAVAGRFYPSSPEELVFTLDALLGTRSSELGPQGAARGEALAIAAVVPHAGFSYSGRIAGETFASLEVPEDVLLLCPNHTGLGKQRSLWSGGAWDSPLGPIPICEELADALERHAGLEPDRLAHVHEHAIEVELPFLKRLEPSVRIVPVCLARLSLPECLTLGEQIASTIRAFGRRVLIVCSTDMSHYISARAASELDHAALERLTALDARGLYETVTERRISMCGYIPTTVGLVAARALGATSTRVVRYGNSAETTGDFARVVGYAGALIH